MEKNSPAVGAPVEPTVRHQLATDGDIAAIRRALSDTFPRQEIDLAAVSRVLATLEAIGRHSVNTIRTNSSDRDDWREDMGYVGKLASGH